MYHDLLIHCIIDLYNLFSTLLDLVPSPTCTLLVSTSFGLCLPISFSSPFLFPSALLLCLSSTTSSLIPIQPLSAICSPLRCFLSNLPGDPQSPCISAFLPPSLPAFLPTLWHPHVAMLPFSVLSQLLQRLGAPSLSQQGIVCKSRSQHLYPLCGLSV